MTITRKSSLFSLKPIVFSFFLFLSTAVNSALLVQPIDTWPDGVVPYVIDESVPPLIAEEFLVRAIEEFETKTAVRFVLRDETNEASFPNYVRINYDEDAVSSNAGTIGMSEGESNMILNSNTLEPQVGSIHFAMRVIVHELGHVVGLYHEHSRLDMWDYFEIDWSLVEDESCPDNRETNLIGIPVGDFDYFSVMDGVPPHCGKNELGGPSLNYLTLTDATITEESFLLRGNLNYQLSPGDIAGINYLYPPVEPITSPSTEAGSGGVPLALLCFLAVMTTLRKKEPR